MGPRFHDEEGNNQEYHQCLIFLNAIITVSFILFNITGQISAIFILFGWNFSGAWRAMNLSPPFTA